MKRAWAAGPAVVLLVGLGGSVRSLAAEDRGARFDQVAADTSRTRAGQALSVWRSAGRAEVARLTGTHWDSTTRAWIADSNWAGAANAGATAYFVEPILRGVLGVAQATGDRRVLDEVAGFFLTYQSRLTTVGEIQRAQAGLGRTRVLRIQGDPAARTIPWIDTRGPSAAECPLCNSQFFHPAAKLIRLIAAIPPTERTPVMRAFLAQYQPLLVQDHLLRLVYVTEWPASRENAAAGTLISLWGPAAAPGAAATYNLLDRDLWFVATAAELLEAHRLDPTGVPLQGEEEKLRRLVDEGVALLRSRTQAHPETRDRTGRVVGSLDYFEGGFDAHPDMAAAGYTGRSFPTAADRRPPVRGSWDVSHVQRLPVVLRSLWDARRALGAAAPDRAMLQATVAQYLYVAFQGDLHRPRFNNFFSGGDGWYRAGYSGRAGFGYPPSAYCDNRDPKTPCLSRGGIAGWGLLSFLSPDLVTLGDSLTALANDTSLDALTFRVQYYGAPTDSFGWHGAGNNGYSLLLGEVLGEYLVGASADPGAPAVPR